MRLVRLLCVGFVYFLLFSHVYVAFCQNEQRSVGDSQEDVKGTGSETHSAEKVDEAGVTGGVGSTSASVDSEGGGTADSSHKEMASPASIQKEGNEVELEEQMYHGSDFKAIDSENAGAGKSPQPHIDTKGGLEYTSGRSQNPKRDSFEEKQKLSPVTSEEESEKGEENKETAFSVSASAKESSSDEGATVPQQYEDNVGADQLYDEAVAALNKTHGIPKNNVPYELLLQASEKNHIKSIEMVAKAYLLGYPLELDSEKALKYSQYLASRGNPTGQFFLGFMSAAGIGMNSSQAKALLYYTFASHGHDKFAKMALGFRYVYGVGVARNCEKGALLYSEVAADVAEIVSKDGSLLIEKARLSAEEDRIRATSMSQEDIIQYYQYTADRGDVQAEVLMGQLYYQGGHGLRADPQKAFSYFHAASQNGNAEAMAFLGQMYMMGKGVQQNNLTAFQYFTAAASQGITAAHNGLGYLYLHGMGVKRDYEEAVKYFQKAADGKNADGKLNLGNMYYNGLGVAKDFKKAFSLFQEASEQGHSLAVYRLGTMYYSGIGAPRSCELASRLFKNVAERGPWSFILEEAAKDFKNGKTWPALVKYSYMSELGYEVAHSNAAFILDQQLVPSLESKEAFARALMGWRRAASQGSIEARVKVGDYYYYGLGTKADFSVASEHFAIAADDSGRYDIGTSSNSYIVSAEKSMRSQALFNLGYMHEYGLGLSEDLHLAKRFYDRAAEGNMDASIPTSLALLKLRGRTWLRNLFKNDVSSVLMFYAPEIELDSPVIVFFLNVFVYPFSFALETADEVMESVGLEADSLVILILCVILAVVLYRRRRRGD
eukprot:Nk52_evm4s78 gene=Nk52_evmTU4s78